MSEAETQTADFAHADIGIVSALPIELAAFFDRCEKVRRYSGDDFSFRGGRYDRIRIVAAHCGMGFARARRATHALIDAHSPPWVLSCGFSGALAPEIACGHVVMANAICDQHGNELKIDLNLPDNPKSGVHVGRLLTADAIVRRVDEKKELGQKHQAVAVDLESLAVAQVCRERNVRFMAIRVISDDLAADLPEEILSLVGSTGSVRFGAALGAVFKRPSSVKQMWKLRENANRAAETMADFLDGVVRQLYNATVKEEVLRDPPK
ncbi:MAG: 5'-methylthioadenosine nucleosidase [Planctomycetaceae bacterium]